MLTAAYVPTWKFEKIQNSIKFSEFLIWEILDPADGANFK